MKSIKMKFEWIANAISIKTLIVWCHMLISINLKQRDGDWGGDVPSVCLSYSVAFSQLNQSIDWICTQRASCCSNPSTIQSISRVHQHWIAKTSGSPSRTPRKDTKFFFFFFFFCWIFRKSTICWWLGQFFFYFILTKSPFFVKTVRF